MSSIDIHPHFVAARGYDDVKTVVGLLKDPIDDEDFVRPDDAPFLPPAYTSTIHITESISAVASVRNSISHEATLVPKERALRGGVSVDDDSVGDADAAHAPFGDGTTDGARSPLAPELDNIAAPYPSYVPKATAPPASTTAFKMRRRASSYHKGARRPKILCIWDVDDTLVATGVSGVRQNLVFREQELVSLFRSAGPNTRHLLLSQGSIDDVFEESGGRLKCIQKFVQRPPPASSAGRRGGAAAGGSGGGASKPSSGISAEKNKSSFGDLFRCGGGKQTKEQPSTSSSSSHRGKNAEYGVGGTSESDMRHFAPGTVMVRLSSVHDRAEQPSDAAFLFDAARQPTCGRASSAALDEKAERMGRWLVLRPEVWGITLASMSTIFPPSRYTAFVNGKVYRKMDVVWSLAMTGEWDSVFFIDNNLSEVGVVRYGMQMSDVLNLRGGRQVWRFFQSEFLLLAASAKLRELELRYGRDITKPPPKPATTAVQTGGTGNGNAANTVLARSKDGAGVKGASLSGELKVKSTATASRDGAGEGGELTPSKSVATSSSDSGPHRGSNGGSSKRRLHAHGDPNEGPACDVDVDVGEDIHIIVGAPPASVHESGDIVVMASSSRSDCLSLNSASPHHHSSNSMPVPSTPSTSPTRSNRDVDLVVVNLHMPCEDYRRVLTTARVNREGQRSLQRNGGLPSRFVGQPVFNGDRSCTDEQYDAILKYFQETESGLFQLLEEEMRMNGYVDVQMSRRWIPGLHTVHAPIHRRPSFIPHMPQFYTPFFDEVEERVVKALQKYGGTSSSCPLHTEAQRQYFALQRVLTFIDPYLTGDLGSVLFDIYIVDGNIPRSLADHLKKALNKVRDRIVQKADRS